MGFDFLVLSYNIQLAKTGEYPVFDTEWPPFKKSWLCPWYTRVTEINFLEVWVS